MKTEGRKCISIVDHLETDVAIKLPQFHAVTVCYTTSFLHGFGKLKFLKVFKLIRKTKPYKTFAVLCKVSQTAAKDVEKFIETVCYSGKEEESSWNKGASLKINENKNFSVFTTRWKFDVASN